MAGQESRVEVEIFGEYYTLKGDSSPEELLMLANYVNRKMKALSGRNPRLSRIQTAVLAALNIAEELKRLQEEHDNLVKIIEPPEEHNKKKNS
ncbi:Cell division protein ZapA [Pelotomaculum sp. FP]|uniref:cell division protein ZapA n=1 Tax=Pelotomaculum sp. FP TaxID=261474 RepID=UPI001065F9D3|nr:cell division protein ZapA [Pelotomaculum sp. FP]TEB14279.1 Cell division protein ZapA [Pelotomaculum sp. FP]